MCLGFWLIEELVPDPSDPSRFQIIHYNKDLSIGMGIYSYMHIIVVVAPLSLFIAKYFSALERSLSKKNPKMHRKKKQGASMFTMYRKSYLIFSLSAHK